MNTLWRRGVRVGLVGALLGGGLACDAGSDDVISADLPTGWGNARRVGEFSQSNCDRSPREHDERATFTPSQGSIQVQYSDAQFRCDQDVEGFVRRDGDALDLLVQPVVMDPDEVARCSCPYNIDMDVLGLPAGSLNVTLLRRGDNLNEDNDPVEIASTTVDVE